MAKVNVILVLTTGDGTLAPRPVAKDSNGTKLLELKTGNPFAIWGLILTFKFLPVTLSINPREVFK